MRLVCPGNLQLSSDVQPPRPLLGRNRALHDLARLYSATKSSPSTAPAASARPRSAAAFAERFVWRWPEGVRTISFASYTPNAADFRRRLLEALLGEGAARLMADRAAEQQTTRILQTAHDWDGLLLIDNYESVMQGLDEKNDEAAQIHGLVGQLAQGGAQLLITSREQQAGFAGEVVYPKPNEPLPGLSNVTAAAVSSTTAHAPSKTCAHTHHLRARCQRLPMAIRWR